MTRKVLQFSKHSGRFIKEFNSITEAGRESNINYGSISQSCKGKLHSAGGYVWRYKSDF